MRKASDVKVGDQNSSVNDAVGRQSATAGLSGRPPKRGLRHAMGREWYLLQVDLSLDGKMDARQRKGIITDLRSSIDADVASLSLEDVLSGLGKPEKLAASYLEGMVQSRPSWAAGVAAAICVLLVYWMFFLTYTLGVLAVATQAGGEFASHFFLVEVMAFSGEDGVGIGWSGDAALWFPLALAVLVFIPASRVWRVFGRRRN